MSENPLSSFFRSKEVYISLPTKCRYFTNKPKLSESGELGIMPMSTRDEMLLKIPDSLYNGEAMYEVIESVAPDIEDPYELCIPDLDIILLATRLASYGKEMPLDTKCPHCKTHNRYSLDISIILSKIKHIPEDHTIELDGLEITFKPNSVKTISARRIAAIETQKIAAQMSESDDLTELKEKFKESLRTATAAKYAIIADAIEKIQMPDGTSVTDPVHIIEWLSNTKAENINVLETNRIIINDNGIQKTFKLNCSNENCAKEFTAPVEFNPAFFFKTKLS